MAGMVDSRQQQLNPVEIVTIASQNMGNQYPLDVMLPAIIAEMSQPNSKQKQFGNTLFTLLTGDGDQAFFRAFNADIPANYIENSKEFCVWAKEDLGLRVLVTQFKDRAISTLFKAISQDPPMPNMGYKEYKTTNGESRIVLNLGA